MYDELMINTFLLYLLQPTVVPVEHFDPSEDCSRLQKAMAGLGTNEKVIIEILAHR